MKRAIVVAILLAAAWPCMASEVRVGAMRYKLTKLVSAADGTIVFRIDTGMEVRKPLAEVGIILLDGQGDLNAAEDLYAQGKFDLAIPKYQRVLDFGEDAMVKELAKARMAQARAGGAGGAASQPAGASAQPSATTPPSAVPVAQPSGGAAQPPVPAAAQPAGTASLPAKAPRPEDIRAGVMPCPECGGAGRQKQTITIDRVPTVVQVDCPRCKGSGYVKLTATAKDEPKGVAGDPAATSAPKIAAVPPVVPRETPAPPPTPAKTPTPTPTAGRTAAVPPGPTAPPIRVESDDPLRSMDAMARIMETRPRNPRDDRDVWDKMTSLQQADAEKDYEGVLADWDKKNDFHGKEVDWVVSVMDVAAGDGGGVVVKGQSPRGYVVSAPMPAEQRETLKRLRKGDTIRVTGTVGDYRFEKNDIFTGSMRAPSGVTLKNPTVAPAEAPAGKK